MRHLTALILVLMLVALPGCKYFKGKKLFGKKADTMAVWQARQDSIRVADSIRKVQERLQAIEDARLDSIRIAEEKRALELKNKYNIIVGSFITPRYARDHAETYRQKGYDVRIIEMEGGRFELVSAEAYENFRTAVERLQYFQDNVEIGAWLYVVK
jgi:hypothetical protein